MLPTCTSICRGSSTSLPPTLRRCLAWIAVGGAEAAIRDGLHRSSFYEARERLRARAWPTASQNTCEHDPTFSVAGR